jgi:hypothetical protein
MFFKKKPKYLTIESTNDSCAMIKFSEIVLIKKTNYDDKFCIEIFLKNGNLFKHQGLFVEKRNQLYEQIKKILQYL